MVKEKEKEKEKEKVREVQKEKKPLKSLANGIKSLRISVPRSKLLKFLDSSEDEMERALMSEVVR